MRWDKYLIFGPSIFRAAPKSAVVKTLPVSRSRFACLESCDHVFAEDRAKKGRQDAQLLECVLPVAEWCNAMFYTWVRSIRRKRTCGARRLRCSMRIAGVREPWRCSPRIDAPQSPPTHLSFNFVYPTYGYAGHGSGAPAGWRDNSGVSCRWTAFEPTGCRRAAKLRDGTRSCRYWSHTG